MKEWEKISQANAAKKQAGTAILISDKPKLVRRDKEFNLILIKFINITGVLMAHTCNPNYLGSRDQEDSSSRPTQANSLRDPILKMPITKKGW
jgi:hypothetical protein